MDSFDASYPMKDISEPGINDVLCGRGGGTNNHIGNRRFRMLVNEHKPRYFAAGKLDKPKVAREVMLMWRKQEPPGRFLIKDANYKLWSDVGDQKAREKASQCLRERRTPCDVLPFRIPGQGGENGMVPSVRDVEVAVTAGLLGSDAYEDDEYNNGELPSLTTSLNGLSPVLAQQEFMREKLQQEMMAQQEQLVLLQQQQMQMEQLHVQQQQLAQLSPDMTSVALQRHEEILRTMQYELKRQQDELEKQQQGLFESMQASAEFMNLPAAHEAPLPAQEMYSQAMLTQKSQGPNKRGVTTLGRESGGKRRVEDEYGEEDKVEVPEPAPPRRSRPLRHQAADNHVGYRRMMAPPADVEWDDQEQDEEKNTQISSKHKMQGYKSHTAAGESLRNDMHKKYLDSTAEDPEEAKQGSLEFVDLNDWATVSARNVAERAKKFNSDASRQKFYGNGQKDLSEGNEMDRFSERSSIMDWKSIRSVTSSKLEQTLENLAKEVGGSPSNSFREFDNAGVGLSAVKSDDASWAEENKDSLKDQPTASSRRLKPSNKKPVNTGTSTISMMSELTDLSADMHALDLALDD
jgi:hypothetical protein